MMFNSKLWTGAMLWSAVAAQTAPGFPILASQALGIQFGTNIVQPAGEQIPRPDTASPPNITSAVWTSTGQGVLLMVDSDVPRNGTRVQLLHWLVSGVTLSEESNSSSLIIPSPGEAEYRQPSPPVGDSPHAYTFVLFSQPENFSVPAQFNDVLQSRVFFNTSAFVAAAGLGDAIAANYIQVQNLTGSATTTFPPPRDTGSPTSTPAASSTGVEFPGAAPAAVLGSGRVFWVGMGTALIAGVCAVAL
ncbi:PEBP-like protein [Amniculicola lignicola CBS 123094]|uniref:PEBP-like protein n=1 Tax=Amniculicola lignicola CBS 123094 TaxID=1392246 RepID=A0A6A5X544_9PLEO|nr:PEBP-like protein [Amniculicola lignicola CBS 123094]